VQRKTILSDAHSWTALAREALDERYGAIGISAVAAAVRYLGEPKAPERTHDDQDKANKAA